MANWNVLEVLGNQYLYVSKNGNDTLASALFGKAATWQSDTQSVTTYSVGDRRTDSTASNKQYVCITAHTKGATTPANDSTNWAFDFDNFQTHDTSKIYAQGSKTCYSNEHYVCALNTSGTFDVSKWTKVTVSNQSAPFLTINAAINLLNADSRFVSYSNIDTNYVISAKIKINLSSGRFYETITSPTKMCELKGTDRINTLTNVSNYRFIYKNLNLNLISNIQYGYMYDCIVRFAVRNDFSSSSILKNTVFVNSSSGYMMYTAIISCIFNGLELVGNQNAIVKNCYFKEKVYLYSSINNCVIDYNCYEKGIFWNDVSKITQSDIRSADVNYNQHSIVATENFNNPAKLDYTVSAGSLLIGAGKDGENIGISGKCIKLDGASTALTSAGGAILANIIKDSVTNDLKREQVAKTAQTGAIGSITLESNASSINVIYNNLRIRIIAGTGSGQTRTISDYDGSTKIASVSVNWDTAPDSSSVYSIIDGYLESADIDLTTSKSIKALHVFNENILDANGMVLKSLFESDVDADFSCEFYMKYSNSSDLSSETFKKFKYSQDLTIDNSGNGNADSGYDVAEAKSLPNFRYLKLKIIFCEI